MMRLKDHLCGAAAASPGVEQTRSSCKAEEVGLIPVVALNFISAGFGLITELLASLLLSFLLVNIFHQHTFVLEHVTFGFHVQLVVQMKVYLLLLSILAQKSSQNSHAVHPDHLLWHTSIRCTMSLAKSLMTSLPFRFQVSSCPCTTVHHLWLPDDQTIFDEFSDVLPRVGVCNLR